jgi:hypothetical protein
MAAFVGQRAGSTGSENQSFGALPDDIESLVLCIISLRHLFLIFKNSNKEEPDCKKKLLMGIMAGQSQGGMATMLFFTFPWPHSHQGCPHISQSNNLAVFKEPLFEHTYNI